MGVKMLLPFVKKAIREANIVEFKGQSIAVDVSCLLHKGLHGCVDIFINGTDNKFYITYVKKHIQALTAMGCHVIMVFDGRPLPAKKEINDGRRQKRKDSMEQGMILLSQGKTSEAVSKFQQAQSLTEQIVENTITEFRSWKNVDVIVAPYESDAQLAYLMKAGYADAVLTEDTDLIVFGCEKIIYKWNVEKGDCVVYMKDKLKDCFYGEMHENFDFVKFRRICILAGCDYLQNGLHGIGLSKSVKFFSKTAQADLRTILPRIPNYLQDKKLKVTQSFVEEFIRAENTFLYQIVFDPKERCQRPLNPYPPLEKKTTAEEDDDFISSSTTTNYNYAGVVCSAAVSVRLALGNSANESSINDKFHLPKIIPDWSIWGGNFESGLKKRIINEEEERKKAKKCGVFQLDSPKKRKRCHDSPEYISLDDSPKKATEVKKPSVKKTPGRPKKSRNEPLFDNESIDDVVSKFKEDISEIKESSFVKVSEEKEVVVEQQTVVTLISSATKSSHFSKEDQSEKENVEPEEEKENVETSKKENIGTKTPFQTPLPAKSASFSAGFSGKKSLGYGKSPYFMGKSPAISNPFKKVEINVNASHSPVTTPKIEEKSKSLLSSVEDEEENNKPTPSHLLNRFAGFRAAGLRRSVTK